ncbi:MAG: hypothetical protein NTY00_04695 [Deltaproteobacteria bacterium]|nr:hypothetical protein [Deltaproteobacteria bacterium]
MKVGLLQEVKGYFICWLQKSVFSKVESLELGRMESKKTFLPMKAETFFRKSF